MSKQKVERYKEYKKNKKKILRAEKRKNAAAKATAWLLGIAVLAVIVYFVGSAALSAYKDYIASRPDYSTSSLSIGDYAGIRAEETTEAATETTEEATEAATTEATEVTEATEEVTEAPTQATEEATEEGTEEVTEAVIQ